MVRRTVFAVFLLALTVMPATASATFPVSQTGRLVFDSDRSGANVWIAQPGGLANVLTPSPSGGGIVSPNGRQLFHFGDRGGMNDILVQPLAGGAVTNLTNTPGTEENRPVLSPDGRQIAYLRLAGAQYDVWVMNADGSGQHPVLAGPATEAVTDWSPDGRTLAINSFALGQFDILLLDLATGRTTNLTASRPETHSGGVFSPDGKSLAYARLDGGTNQNIGIMNIDGSDRAPNFAVSAMNEVNPQFTPDGTALSYVFDNDDVYRVPLAGGAAANLTPGTASSSENAHTWEAIFKCAGRRATIVGTDSADKLKGTKKSDVIVANGGNDKILGRKGNDRLCGGRGKDKLIGGPGKDKLLGGKGKDKQRQ
jgi:Tol biopolymer transport system component